MEGVADRIAPRFCLVADPNAGWHKLGTNDEQIDIAYRGCRLPEADQRQKRKLSQDACRRWRLVHLSRIDQPTDV